MCPVLMNVLNGEVVLLLTLVLVVASPLLPIFKKSSSISYCLFISSTLQRQLKLIFINGKLIGIMSVLLKANSCTLRYPKTISLYFFDIWLDILMTCNFGNLLSKCLNGLIKIQTGAMWYLKHKTLLQLHKAHVIHKHRTRNKFHRSGK